MEKLKHTEGEWIVVENEDSNGYDIECIEKGFSIGKMYIAKEIQQGEDDGLSDAKLMAASKELLIALKELLKWYKDATEQVPRNYQVVEMCEAAIKKATE